MVKQRKRNAVDSDSDDSSQNSDWKVSTDKPKFYFSVAEKKKRIEYFRQKNAEYHRAHKVNKRLDPLKFVKHLAAKRLRVFNLRIRNCW